MIEASAEEPSSADRWREAITDWELPPHLVDPRPRHDPRRSIAHDTIERDTIEHDTIERDTTSARWAREVLPPRGGTVLDVGCGDGRSVAPLIPPATEVIGVDRTGAMLDEFVDAASRAGVARRTVHGAWPEVIVTTPVADVAICHHVLYDVADVVPFVLALTARARLAVVVEIPVRHPMTAWNEAFAHFWGLDRPAGPTHVELIDVLRELGLDPEHTVSPRPARPRIEPDPDRLVEVARRRLALPVDRDDELARWLAARPPAFVSEVATVRWPGAADPGGHPIA